MRCLGVGRLGSEVVILDLTFCCEKLVGWWSSSASVLWREENWMSDRVVVEILRYSCSL